MGSITIHNLTFAIFLSVFSTFIAAHTKDKAEADAHQSKHEEHSSVHNASDHSHHHALQDVSHLSAIPTVSFNAVEDPAGGWNVHVTTSNFTFAPELVNKAPIDGQGHAHLYVDEEKVARLYGPWFHLPKLPSGRHSIKVQLNSNNHLTLAIGENPIEATMVITQN